MSPNQMALDALKLANNKLSAWACAYPEDINDKDAEARIEICNAIDALEAVQVEPAAEIVQDENGYLTTQWAVPYIPNKGDKLYLNATPQQAAPGWQPIETAPKDGTFFLASDGTDFAALNYPLNHYMGVWHWNDQRKQWRGAAQTLLNPTHWISIPAVPRSAP